MCPAAAQSQRNKKKEPRSSPKPRCASLNFLACAPWGRSASSHTPPQNLWRSPICPAQNFARCCSRRDSARTESVGLRTPRANYGGQARFTRQRCVASSPNLGIVLWARGATLHTPGWRFVRPTRGTLNLRSSSGSATQVWQSLPCRHQRSCCPRERPLPNTYQRQLLCCPTSRRSACMVWRAQSLP